MFVIYIIVAALSLNHLNRSGDTMLSILLRVFEPLKVSPLLFVCLPCNNFQWALAICDVIRGLHPLSKCLEACASFFAASSRVLSATLRTDSSAVETLFYPGVQDQERHHPHSISFKD